MAQFSDGQTDKHVLRAAARALAAGDADAAEEMIREHRLDRRQRVRAARRVRSED